MKNLIKILTNAELYFELIKEIKSLEEGSDEPSENKEYVRMKKTTLKQGKLCLLLITDLLYRESVNNRYPRSSDIFYHLNQVIINVLNENVDNYYLGELVTHIKENFLQRETL